MSFGKFFGHMLGLAAVSHVVKKQVKKDKNVVYGARALKAQMGFLARPTNDWDIYSNKPRRSSHKLQKSLDRRSGGDSFYSTPSKFHKGTHKVYWKGEDMKKGTKDDVGVADFSKPERKVKTVRIQGIRYAHVSETARDKKRSLKDKNFAFRHDKDRDDLRRIKTYRRLRL